MRDLSKLLWCDLKNDDERIEFLLSGRAYDTGIISSNMIPVVVDLLKYRQNTKKLERTKTYEKKGQGIGKLVDEKQAAYGDSFGKSGEIIKILYPEGINPEQYKDALAIIRVIDKLFRIANDKGYGGENPFMDIAGYGLLGSVQDAK